MKNFFGVVKGRNANEKVIIHFLQTLSLRIKKYPTNMNEKFCKRLESEKLTGKTKT